MKHVLFPLFACTALCAAQEPAPPLTPSVKTPPTAIAAPESRSFLTIDPKARAKDYVAAFELLRKEKPALKIDLQTSSGTLSNIVDLSVSEEGTLMFVKIPSNQGTKYLILPLEHIQEIAYSP